MKFSQAPMCVLFFLTHTESIMTIVIQAQYVSRDQKAGVLNAFSRESKKGERAKKTNCTRAHLDLCFKSHIVHHRQGFSTNKLSDPSVLFNPTPGETQAIVRMELICPLI